jgi:hypothetical protein
VTIRNFALKVFLTSRFFWLLAAPDHPARTAPKLRLSLVYEA